MDGDYAYIVANARKLIWIPALVSAGSLLLAQWTLSIHLTATAVTVASALVLNRRALKLGPFLLALNASYAAPLLSLTVLVVAIALNAHDIGPFSREQIYILGALFSLFLLVSTLIFVRIWEARRQQFEAEAVAGSLSFEDALALMTGRGGLRFWRSGAGLSLMTSIAVLSSWTGYRYGFGAKATVACTLMFITWSLIAGGVLAQCVVVIRHRRFASMQLYRAFQPEQATAEKPPIPR